MTDETTSQELTVYLRSSAPSPARDRQEEVVERAERLVMDGRIEGVTVRRWRGRIPVENGSDTAETVETFRSRATEIGHTIEPFFQEHERSGAHEIVVPIICIAVHVDAELKRLFPCRDETEAYSVWDCLTALETDGELVGLGD